MDTQFPIECTCVHRQGRFQLSFARNAAALLPHFEDSSYDVRGRALVVLAQTEEALERPLRIIRETYASQIRIGPATVRYRRGETLEEPYMAVRVLCAPDHLRSVEGELKARGALISESERKREPAVIQATAPLAALLGFPQWLADVTAARGHYSMWLSHYAPVPDRPPPGGHAA